MPNLKTPLPLLPPVIALIALMVSLILDTLLPSSITGDFAYPPAGWALGLGGLALMLWGRMTFKRKETPVRPGETPTKLVIAGPFRFTRNPMYLGMTVLLSGIGLGLGSWAGILAPVAFFILINRYYIPFEEKLMTELFGKEYLAYQQKVRRWV